MGYRLLKASIILVLTIFMAGCGRTYHIKGRVLFLPQLGSADGMIAEITGQPIPAGGEPVAGAKVRMIHELNKDGRPVENTGWQTDTLTDANGNFEISDYAAPYDNVRVGLEVSKDGYKTVFTTYIDYVEKDKGDKLQVFFVVPSRSASNNSFNQTPR
jgi:hypothetical protein